MEKPAPTDYPIHELIARRWSPRAFSERLVSDEDVLLLLEAGRWSASCYNEQPWRYLVASRARPDQFEAMLGCLVPQNARWAQGAALLVIAVASTHFTHNGKANQHAWYDVGQASALISMQATAMGLFVHQMAGFDAAKTRALYEIPEDHDPVAAMAIGYPGDIERLPEDLRERERAPRSRKPLADLVYEGRWQARFSGLDR